MLRWRPADTTVRGTEKLLRRLKDQLDASKARVEELEQRDASAASAADLDALRAQLTDLRTYAERAATENESLTQRLTALQAEHEAAVAERADDAKLKRELDEALNRVAWLEREHATLQDRLNESQSKVGLLLDALESAPSNHGHESSSIDHSFSAELDRASRTAGMRLTYRAGWQGRDGSDSASDASEALRTDLYKPALGVNDNHRP